MTSTGSNPPAHARKVVVPARAKLNLDLAIVGRRADGYHELRTRMQAIDLHDLIEVEVAQDTSLITTGFELGDSTTRNTVLMAHSALEKALGRSLPTRFHLHKRIPPGSGLGGASSDAAAALRAMVAVHGVETDLWKIAPSVGADVTFFLSGGAALVEGIGAQVTPIESAPAWYAIAWPLVELRTADVYTAWDEVKGEGPNELRRAAGQADGRVDEFATQLGKGWQMTGSGSAFFRVCTSRSEAWEATEELECWTAITAAVGAWT